MKPLFLTFEGLDGSGKSTHLKSVARRLREAGESCCLTREPGGTELGQEIRSVFLDPKRRQIDGRVELLLVFASRRQHLLEVIEPALQAGQHVLCDRFTDSTIAYQGYGRGVDLELIREVDHVATGCRVADATVLFDLPAEEARRRGQSPARRAGGSGGVDRLDAEDLEFYRRVRQGYLALQRQHPERVHLIDSSGPRRETAKVVDQLVDRLFAEALETAGRGSGGGA